MARKLTLAIFAVGLALSQAAAALAASYTVTPVRVELKPGERSYLLNLRNDSDKELRFQILPQAWSQSVDGEALLTPSDNLVVFPALLTLAPGTERKVRIGLTKPLPSEKETTYRVIFEELPDARTPGSGAQVQIVTKMSIPVFVQPTKLQRSGAIANGRFSEGVLRFDVTNNGNTYFTANGVTITGRKCDGSAISKNLQGWYVLAGGRREYVVPFSASEAEGLSRIEIQVATDIREGDEQVMFNSAIDVAGCKPQGQ